MMVMHIRIVPIKQPEDDHSAWRPTVGRYGGQDAGEPPKSLPILIWELLKTDARSIEELCWRLNAPYNSICKALHKLRRHGQEIERRRGMYHLHDGPPLIVEETRGGMRLGPTKRTLRKMTQIERGEESKIPHAERRDA